MIGGRLALPGLGLGTQPVRAFPQLAVNFFARDEKRGVNLCVGSFKRFKPGRRGIVWLIVHDLTIGQKWRVFKP
jgi:hypothetical protein